ncbi:MAG: YaaR family protein [Treponema sp.]|jgi:uncharacterized protein YaaR (DUF327 family)|nr:YaaR family protein [Treponema sp.]
MANGIDPVQSSLYFSALANANKDTEKTKKKKSVFVGKFFDILHEVQDDDVKPLSEELAMEIAGMSHEEALVHLKDKVDMTGDKLKEVPVPDNFVAYKKALANFLQYALSRSYDTETVRGVRNSKTRRQKEYTIVKVVDEKLEQLATEMLYNHRDNIRIANKIDEIKGLIVDCFY